MNNVTWRSDLIPAFCKNPWKTKNKLNLGRTQYYCVKDSYKLDSKNCKELIFNHKFISLQQIDNELIQCKNLDITYVFLAVNKYLIYTMTDSEYSTYSDLDLLLHWQSIVGWKAAYMSYVDNDHGVVGNFDFPITQILLERNE